MIIQKPAGTATALTVEFGSPPAGPQAMALEARHERARRNSQWLQTHWHQLLPQALGKFLAVAGEEAFVADTPEQAWAWAAQHHPDDDTATVQYVSPAPGPRVYAHCG
jgi:hypothetical protein